LVLHKRKINKLEIVFDEKSKRNFVLGFRKRRKERQEYAKTQAKQQYAKEKAKLKRREYTILDKQVAKVEAVKQEAQRLYESLHNTTTHFTDEKVVTTTITPLFGNTLETDQPNNHTNTNNTNTDNTNNRSNKKRQGPVDDDNDGDDDGDSGDDVDDGNMEEDARMLEKLHKSVKRLQSSKIRPKPRNFSRGGEDGGGRGGKKRGKGKGKGGRGGHKRHKK